MSIRPKHKIVDLIFNNLRIVFLLFVFLAVFGVASVATMQRQGFPEVLVNISVVSVPYPNASADQVEEEIIKPIEEVLSELDDVTEYQTTAYDSAGIAVVTFDEGADLDPAIAKLTSKISSISFPEDALDPQVEKFSTSGTGDFIIAVTGPDDSQELFNEAEAFKRELEETQGVKSVTALNPLTPEIVISFRQADLEANGITRSQVEDAVRFSQFSAPIGSLVTADQRKMNLSISTSRTSIEDIRSLPIKDDLKLSNVADVTERLNNNEKYNRIGFRDYDNSSSEFYIKRAIVFSVDSDDDADILDLEERISESINGMADRDVLSKDTKVITLFSIAEQTRDQIDEITSSMFGRPIDSLESFSFLGYLFGGLFLVVLLLFIFMNARVAILAALAIPLSLFVSTIYLKLNGIGLNTLVLFSMILAIGLVVDPTIVFLESLQRYKEQGYDGREAASKTMSTVGLGIMLAVATNILVFVPFGIVSGFFGEIIKYIPATVIPAMVASLVIPVVFFTPIAAKLLKPKNRIEMDLDPELIGVWRFSRILGGWIEFILGGGFSRMILRVLIVVVGVSLPIVIGIVMMNTGRLEIVQFSHPDDAEAMFVFGSIDDAFTFEKAVYDVIVPMQGVIAEQPEVENFSYFQQSGNSFSLLLTLLPIDVRKDEGMRKGDEVARDLNKIFKDMDLEAELSVATDSPGPPQGQYPIRVRLLGNDIDVLASAAADVTSYLEGLEEITDVEDNISKTTTAGSVTLALEKDDKFASNPLMIYGIVKDRLGERDLGDLTIDGRDVSIISTVDPTVASVDELTSVTVAKIPVVPEQPIDNSVPPQEAQPKFEDVLVSDVITGTENQPSRTIRRINGRRYVEVSAAITDDADPLEVQKKLDEYLDEDKLISLGLRGDATSFKGEADSITQSFTELFISLAIAIFLIYVLLVSFFRSFLEPFIILFAIPLGMIGVFAAIALTTGQLGFLELLGVVAMAGIVVNVTILLIDFANQLQKTGSTPGEAISMSVAVRFRPIVLTQLTAFGSLIPLVFLSPFWKGLAAAIIFGIISSALLSLFVTPVLYLWSNTIGRTVSRIGSAITRRLDQPSRQTFS